MATFIIKVGHRAHLPRLLRLLRPAVRLGHLHFQNQNFTSSSTPTVVDKQEKAVEVIDDDGKVEK